MSGFLFDSNLWIALTFAAHPLHDRAGEQLRRSSPTSPLSIIRIIELSALRLITTPAVHRAFGVPYFSNREAIPFLTSLFQQTQCSEIEEPKGTRELWLRLADAESASPKVWMDAYLAAVCIQGGLELITLDSDFLSFKLHGLNLTIL
ncbi:MAG: PIN domain-containing protein [Spirochaetaceae bacterium]|nr:MAG: PIN domain-containing protein [Spirochaetaceae bacterium]